MLEVKTKLRRWGNSFGVVVPLKAVEDEGVSEGDQVIVLIKREIGNSLRGTFGTSKSKKSAKQIMKEMDEELNFG